MMPTSPPPPLSFRTAGFPQYGWKVGLSGSAFPHAAQVKPAPSMPLTTRRFTSALRTLWGSTLCPALCQNGELSGALPFEALTPLPQRSSLRSGFCCPSPSTLNRPHPSHSQAHPDFAAARFIQDAFAVLVRLGDPRVVPCFCCQFLLDMSSSTTPGIPSAACTQSLTDDAGLRPFATGSAFPSTPPSASGGGRLSRLHWFAWLQPVEWLASLGGSGQIFPADRGFYSWASIGLVTLPDTRYNYSGNWAISTGGTLTRWNCS